MSQATTNNVDAATLELQKRVEELESVLRTVLEQINTHQVYDKDARRLLRRALGSGSGAETPVASTSTRAREFPSMFPSASSNFV